MSKIKFTTVIAVDDEHLPELEAVWPTWRAFRPEIMENPLLVIYDDVSLGFPLPLVHDTKLNHIVDHPNMRVMGARRGILDSQQGLSVDDATALFASQRELMLTAFVHASRYIETPWYLKLDTDCVAMHAADWIDPEWFTDNPAFIASPWGYTKPADALPKLDEWASQTPWLSDFDPPEYRIAGDRAKSRRIISYCMFGNTEWTRKVAKVAGPKLPVPSQDTLLWYCAARRNKYYKRVQMKNYGWRHLNGLNRLRDAAREALANVPKGGAA